MEATRRQRLSGGVLATALLALAIISALSASTAAARTRSAAPAAAPSASCLIHSLPSFVAQGEFATAATVGDVIEVECNPFVYGTGAEITITASQLYSRCNEISWYVPNENGQFREARGRSVNLHLDVDGNANVGLIAGPHCMPGESLITLDENEPPYETFTTSFQVLPAVNTPQGVYAMPPSQVEDAESSGVVTLVEAEFTGASEAKVRLASQQLYDRCQRGDKLLWVRENRQIVGGPELADEHAVELDNNGNGFALAIGSDSCAEGPSLIEADLESSPFTTETTEFTVLPPQVTEEPAFAIEKRQEIEGSGAGFTTAPLTGQVGDTVDYEIIVTDTSNVTETFTNFNDPHCDAGTVHGGPGVNALVPGEATTYTCHHRITTGGTYVNQASDTGLTVGGRPLEKTSNQVEVTTPVPAPGFAIEKLQEIAGSGAGFASAPLTGLVGQTVDYEILVKNTGNVPLKFSAFTDAQCDSGTIAGGPGSSAVGPGATTTYTCSHQLVSPGTVVNVATVTGTPPEEGPTTHSSEPVEVSVAAAEPGFSVEKLQRIAGSGGSFTTAQLTAAVGATVEYEIIVKDTGNVPLTLSSFSDPRCDAGTIAGGPGAAPLAAGASTTFTCTHLVTTSTNVVNVATVRATPPGEPPLPPMESPKVEVVVPGPGSGVAPQTAGVGETPHGAVLACTIAKPVLRGISGPERGTFTVKVSAAGISKVTFYLDGHKIKTLTHSQAKGGTFKLTINAHKLPYGLHRVSFKTLMTSSNCASIASSSPFVRPRAAVAPFTG